MRIVSPTTSIPPHPDTDDVYTPQRDTLHQRSTQSQDTYSLAPAASADSAYRAGTPNTSYASDARDSQDAVTSKMATVSRTYQSSSQNALSPSSVPANPFSRTLATIEPERESGEDRTTAERVMPSNGKASLDVESFKNLLLTGKPTPRTSAPSAQTAAPPNASSTPQFESGSSTDTSSISRQSLFEPPQQVHVESPRTSYEMAESEEDEHVELVSEAKKGKRKPPPAPKHRHGRLVTPRKPQVVSFDSFAATEPATSPVARSKDNSDVNKPLPPTPLLPSAPHHKIVQETIPYEQPTVLSKTTEALAPAHNPTLQKKAPPPVPLTRRQSQLRTSTAGNRSRSNSSLTMSSQHSIDQLPSPAPSNQDPVLGTKSPPPPPPSRHGARLANTSTSSTNSSSTELPQRSMSLRVEKDQAGIMQPRRSTLDSEPPSPASGVDYSLSKPSSRGTQRAVSNESTGSTMPPPPPPPRRRQSNRSSIDQPGPYIPSSSPTESRRTSNEYRRTSIDSKRRTSVASESSLRHEYAPVDDKAGNEYALYSPNEESENMLTSGAPLTDTRNDSSNILDDMEKFQREIDELRNRYKKPT